MLNVAIVGKGTAISHPSLVETPNKNINLRLFKLLQVLHTNPKYYLLLCITGVLSVVFSFFPFISVSIMYVGLLFYSYLHLNICNV